jgi:adenine-specific DNA methylase
MIPKECKRLAEVDFPIAVVSAHSAREKSIRHGHPSTLHLWWARRPLAACRAMLLALLLPDPCDENCPAGFKDKARALLRGVQREIGPRDIDLQKALLKFIGDFSNWDLAANQRYVEVGRGLIKAAHGDEAPLVVDPFAGGGSIPLEALRLGCEAYASDLNPVACLILKVMLEDIPRHGPALADELRKVGAEIKKQAEKELARYYPPDPDGATPIAYLWARTVRCESPNCDAEIPLMRSFWLCKKPSRMRALRYEVKRAKDRPPDVEFEVFTPRSEKEVPRGTVARGNASCPACQRVLPVERVRVQLREQRGGADTVFDAKGHRIGGARLLTVVTLKDDKAGRQYRVASERDYEAVWKAQKAVAKLAREKLPDGISVIPDEPLPPQGTLGFRVQLYGMTQWGDLFTARQKLALSTLGSCVANVSANSAVKDLLSLVTNRVASRSSSLCLWRFQADQEKVEHIFGRQAFPPVWDFAESVTISESTGSFSDGLGVVAQAVQFLARDFAITGQVQLLDACASPLPDNACSVWFTDPPYYDAIPYSDLSDFFFVWLRRTLRGDALVRDPYDAENPLTPKAREIVQDEVKSFEGRPKDRAFFEQMMARVFATGRRVTRDDGIASVVFAHKTTEGWEALLSGMVKGGWIVTGSWPIATEAATRLRARESAALATSVHLICRPRPEDAPVGDWAEVFRELPNRIGDWMERLSSEGVRGADLVFACIGPAMEIYSRYSRVEDAEGRPIPLGGDPEATEPHKRGFLAYVWEIVGRTALEQVLGTAEARARNGAAGALEEDARLTALFLWTHQSTSSNGASNGAGAESSEEGAAEDADEDDHETPGGATRKGLTLIYDVVRRFSQPLGIHLDTWNGRIIETKKGIVRLLPVRERADYLLGEDGVSGAADLIERGRGGPIQFSLLGDDKRAETPRRRSGGKKGGKSTFDEAPTVAPGTTTLDRVHIAMLLQASGKSNALRTMLKAEQDRGPDFLRLANASSALYPRDSEEKRLLDAMLLAVPKMTYHLKHM